MSSYSRTQLENWLKTITNIKGKVLDIGGSQLSIVKRLDKNELYIDDYKILDLEKPHECKEDPDIICDLNKPRLLDDHYDDGAVWRQYFDVAFCMEVSEYWWNPSMALTAINYFLKQGGLLYISFHFIYPVHNPAEQDYLRYTPIGVKKLLYETGFEVLEMEPRLFKENINLRMDGMRPAKDYGWHQWQGCLVKCVKI